MSIPPQGEPSINRSVLESRGFAKLVKEISLPLDVPNASDHRPIELENQVQHLMEALLASKSSIQVNKIASLCELCSGPHDGNYCMENPKQAFVYYESSRTDEAGVKWFIFKLEQNNLGDTYNSSWKGHLNLSHIQEECPKNPGLGVAKYLENPSQALKGVPVGLKVGIKPTKVYRHVSKMPTANTSDNKKKCMVSTKEEACPKNPGLGVAKYLENPSQALKGVSVGLKVGIKPTKVYRHVSKMPTANTSGNKKKCMVSTKEVSNLNPFDVLNSVENDGDTSTTPIVDKIRKLEKLIIIEKVTLVDDDGKPLKKVDYPGDHDSENEVESVDNDMARSMASEKVGFGTKILLEQ
nr:hypothetical protein [Tanacetum cinerariifolium]